MSTPWRCGSRDTTSGEPCGQIVQDPDATCHLHSDGDDDRDRTPEYAALEIPPRSEWHTANAATRRAVLLELWKRKGDYRALNQSELAREFGVDQSVISRDFDRLSEYVVDRVGARRVMAIIHTSYEKALADAGDDVRDRVAATKAWSEFLFRSGELEAVAERVEVDGEWRVTSDVVTVTRSDLEGDSS